MKNKAYIITMSGGEAIKIDSDEIQNVLQGIKNKQPVMVRQGIFNPSFYVSIAEDKKRTMDFLEETKYGDEKSLTQRVAGVPRLKDIFAEMRELADKMRIT